MALKNAISIDLEEWFTVYNFATVFPHDTWDDQEQRCVGQVKRLLALFKKYNVKATFFILGWVAERQPDLIKEIAADGHELASHGYGHELVKEIGEERFREDLKKSLDFIRAAVPEAEIVGYRAPSFSINPDLDWFFKALDEFGLKYDSSLFPVALHPDYANSGVPLDPYKITETITEFPMTCVELAGKNLPCSGGGYFRLFPYWWFRWALKKVNKADRSAVFYLHPWEIDPEQPRITSVPLSKQFRHYNNLHKCEKRLERLLQDFSFTTVRDVLGL